MASPLKTLISSSVSGIRDLASAPSDIASAVGSSAKSLASEMSGRKFAREQRDYNTRMANSVHQREVEDLKLAGLNPMLAVGMRGSPVPDNPTPVSSAGALESVAKIGGGFLKAGPAGLLALYQGLASIRDLNSAANYKDTQASDTLATQAGRIQEIISNALRNMAQIQNLDIDSKLKETMISKVIADIDVARASLPKIKADTASSAASARELKARAGHLESTLPAAQASGETEAAIENSAFGRMGRIMRRAPDLVPFVGNLLNLFKTNK